MAYVTPFVPFKRSRHIFHHPSSAGIQRCLANRLQNGIVASATDSKTVSEVASSSPARPSVSLVSLGCPKNVTDAEVMLGDLSSHGIKIQASGEPADVIVVNTCGFVEDAKRESLDEILSAAKLKQNGHAKAVIVTGCLAQRYAEALGKELPEVDSIVGFEHYDTLSERVLSLSHGTGSSDTVTHERVQVGTANVPFRPEHERFRLGPKHTVYVRLAEGCSHACTFCAIPGQFRGSFRSKPWPALTSEIEHLVRDGARELVFIAEDTNQYGMDFANDSRRLSDLLHHIAKDVDGVDWIRLLYCYPSYFTDELVKAMGELDVVCKYVDMPLQHISDRVLGRMKRPGRAHTEALLDKLRNGIPGLALRTSFITGFPGESEEDHAELVEFLKASRFDHAGFFVYSEEEGTPAAEFEDAVPMEVREARRDELVSVQQNIEEEKAAEKVGRVLEVIVDRIEDGHSIGRTRGDAPEIDGQVHILQRVEPGTILPVRILGNSAMDLYGEAATDEHVEGVGISKSAA